MLDGKIKQFGELYPGQWFVMPGSNGVEFGIAARFRDEIRPVVISATDAKSESDHGIWRVYAPRNIEISIDTLSLQSLGRPVAGHIVCSDTGNFLSFTHFDRVSYINLMSGVVDDPGSPALGFCNWRLIEKKADGYAPLLTFNAANV